MGTWEGGKMLVKGTCETCKFSPLHGWEEPCYFCDEIYSEWTPKEEEMNYPKLEVFDIVELRDGRLAVVLLVSEDPDEKNLALYSRSHASANSQLIRVNQYNDQLYPVGYEDEIADDYVIMKVLKYSRIRENSMFSYAAYMRLITDILIQRALCRADFKSFNMKDRLKPYDWTWVREECKELTMADIEAKFGCKVKIIKEE